MLVCLDRVSCREVLDSTLQKTISGPGLLVTFICLIESLAARVSAGYTADRSFCFQLWPLSDLAF